jgi:hypothetical protein
VDEGSTPSAPAKLEILIMKKSHYCFDGSFHEELCNCDCQSCENIKATIKRELFNKRLSEKIAASFRTVFNDREFVDAFIRALKD